MGSVPMYGSRFQVLNPASTTFQHTHGQSWWYHMSWGITWALSIPMHAHGMETTRPLMVVVPIRATVRAALEVTHPQEGPL